MTMPTGHPRESDLRWTASPMWLAMMDAAAACGLEDRMDEARITDAKVWAKKGDPHWPSEDKAVRDRFQLLWTANVQARCGLDPHTARQDAPTNLPLLHAKARSARDAMLVDIRRMHAEGMSGADIGRALGIGKNSALRILRDVGLLPPPRYAEVSHAA